MKIIVKYEFEVSEEDIRQTYYEGFMDYIKSKDVETIKHLGKDCVHAGCSGGADTLKYCPCKITVELCEE